MSRQEEFFYQQIGLKFKEETREVLRLEIALYGAETWTLRKVDSKYLESFEMWCWRMMEKISWTDRVRNEQVLHKSQGGEEYPIYNKQKGG